MGWEEQERVKYHAQGYNTRAHTGLELTTFESQIRGSTAELRWP